MAVMAVVAMVAVVASVVASVMAAVVPAVVVVAVTNYNRSAACVLSTKGCGWGREPPKGEREVQTH